MVELQLSTNEWQNYMKDHYVSVRVGEVQKLAKLSDKRSFKFPKSAVTARKYGKVEIFRRIGQAVVCVDPEIGRGTNEVEVSCEGDVKISFEAEVCEPGAAKAPAARKEQHAPASPSSVSQKAAAYLEQHHLEVRLSDAMQAVLRERPEDPATFLANMLLSNASVVAKLPKVPNNEAPQVPEAPPVPPMAAEEPEQAAKCAAPSQQSAKLEVAERVLPSAASKAAGPAPTATFNQLPSVGSWLSFAPAAAAAVAQAAEPKEEPAVAAPEPAPALAAEADRAAQEPFFAPDTDTGFMLTNVQAIGPGFWDTGMSMGLMF